MHKGNDVDTEMNKEEIEKLNIELKAMRGAANSYKAALETAKSDAIKEFAERLKERSYIRHMIAIEEKAYQILEGDLGNLVKEMTETTE